MVMRDWPQHYRRMNQCREAFEKIAVQRKQLLEELHTQKSGWSSERMDPANVLAREKIDRILGQLHKLIGQDRHSRDEARQLLRIALRTQDQWGPLVNDEIKKTPPPAEGSDEAGTRQHLALAHQGHQLLQNGDRKGFARLVLGDLLGPLTYRALINDLKRIGKGDGGSSDLDRSTGPHRHRRYFDLPPGDRHKLMGRLRRLQRRQSELAEMMEQQQREIQRLRNLIEGAGESGRPDEEDPPPRPPPRPGPQHLDDSSARLQLPGRGG